MQLNKSYRINHFFMKVAIDTTNECGLSNKMCDSVKEHKGDAVLYI